jgi:segregation and condensation protein A
LSYLVHLQQFEGPLGLLLYLIRKEEMDVLDINVNEITRQYLEYIRMMKELDLEVAGDFVAMAATLIHIKSRMLLPQYNEGGEAVEVEDPRKELVQKLLDYQKYQEAAKLLYERPLLGRDVFTRGIREDLRSDEEGAIILDDEGLFGLIAAYRRVVRKAQRAVHKVRPRVQSIAQRVLELKDRLLVGTRVIMADLINATGPQKRTQLLVTFLSMLELGRMGFVSVFQSEVYGDIYVEPKKPIERNVLERVQEFDAGDAESVASSIISDAIEEKIDMAEAMALDERATTMGDAVSGQLSLAESAEGPELLESSHEMATDDEILAAEREIEKLEAERVQSEVFVASEEHGEASFVEVPTDGSTGDSSDAMA